jgi:DNA mismatch repair protein MutL
MSDVIKLLPDSVANQIAAGEVIQRPASAVKELLENAIDAGATHIKLIIKDAGKTLIQVVDNGSGMTETDARLCFERHATSKITEAGDLFKIRTMGFRGEALASMAAIARVELKTRIKNDPMGTEVIIEASSLKNHQPCQCQPGTSISVKNLFFNTPARRNFLKSDQVEKGHIMNEFTRISLARPEVAFMLYQNTQLTHQLDSSNLKQRIVNIFGGPYKNRLVPVEEKTEIVSISGFVGKPEFAKKKRGEQYFFVNHRYIRAPYLGHAVEQAYLELIPEDMYPSYFLYLELDPEQLDVNVHPTKTEIKFQDERYIYQILKAAIKRGLGKYHIAPSLDFDRETAFDQLKIDPGIRPVQPRIQVNPDYNPFQTGQRSPGVGLTGRVTPETWERLFQQKEDPFPTSGDENVSSVRVESDWSKEKQDQAQTKFLQVNNRFIIASVRSGIMLIDQQRAHERILYERYMDRLEKQNPASQQLLFPENIHLIDNDADLVSDLLPQLQNLGFGISRLKKGSFVIHAVPPEIEGKESMQHVMEGMLEQFQKNRIELKGDNRSNLARSLAKKMAVKYGMALKDEEMNALTEDLFACRMPYQSPAGKPTVQLLGMDELSEKFK